MRSIMGASKFLAILSVIVLGILYGAMCDQDTPSAAFLMDGGNSTGNVSSQCSSLNRNEGSIKCPDPSIIFNLYSGPDAVAEEIDVQNPDWLKTSKFDPTLPTILMLHGYRGGDSLMPLVILKNAYIKRGKNNVIVADWGPLAKVPCYIETVNNLKPVAKCTAHMLKFLQDSGVNMETVTCVGHSVGAHLCGVLANYVPQKLEKIIALDPARPLLKLRGHDGRLDAKDAKIVQVIRTNAGFYGESGNSIGTVDFCVNNGKQPHCTGTANEQLCSHIQAVCFYAASLDTTRAFLAQPCVNRCPSKATDKGPKREPVLMSEIVDNSASGMYCVESSEPPFCLKSSEPEYGDKRCCPTYVKKN